MQVNGKMYNMEPSVFTTRGFMIEIEAHYRFLLNHPKTKLVELSTFKAYIHEGDAWSFFDSLKIPRKYHQVMMKLNGIRSNGDLPSDVQYLIVPDADLLENIAATYISKRL